MKLLFITGLYPHEKINLISRLSNGRIQNAPNAFQWAVVEGLQKNNIDYEVLSFPFLASYPIKFKKMVTPSSNIYYQNHLIGRMVSYCNLMIYKKRSIYKKCKREVNQWIENNKYHSGKLVILTYSPYVPFIKSIRSIKNNPNVIVASIITDLVDNIFDFKLNRSFLKRIQCYKEIYDTKSLYKYIDKFVLLSEPMLEKIPEARGKFIVIEGISAYKEFIEEKKKSEYRDILYTGTLEKYSGVSQLLEAFIKINIPNVRLVICGVGELEYKIRELAAKENRIIFKGLVTRDEVLKLQEEALVLINPRRPDGEITRFSFPSKTMEYLSSGTPMIGYKLEGIPSEYYEHFYTIDDLSESTLVNTLLQVLSLPSSELNAKAEKAFRFIMTKKTAELQVKKIIDFLC